MLRSLYVKSWKKLWHGSSFSTSAIIQKCGACRVQQNWDWGALPPFPWARSLAHMNATQSLSVAWHTLLWAVVLLKRMLGYMSLLILCGSSFSALAEDFLWYFSYSFFSRRVSVSISVVNRLLQLMEILQSRYAYNSCKGLLLHRGKSQQSTSESIHRFQIPLQLWEFKLEVTNTRIAGERCPSTRIS